jgi:uroporphyrinogen-III synthase
MPTPYAHLLLTRPEPASKALWKTLKPQARPGLSCVISPLLEIVETGNAPDLTHYKGVIFTSINGVEHCLESAELPAFCVGARTAKQAQKRGWQAHYGGQTAQEFIQTLQARAPNGPLLHICGTHRRGDIAENLTKTGITTDICEVYHQELRSLSHEALQALFGPVPVVVPLFSPRTASQFYQCYKGNAPLYLISLSDAVAQETKSLPCCQHSIASALNLGAMTQAVLKTLVALEAGERGY